MSQHTESARATNRARSDRWLGAALVTASGLVGSLVVLILCFLTSGSLEALGRVGAGHFVTDAGWHPNHDGDGGAQFNLMPMVAATLATTAGAILVAGPLGILAAVFCRFYAPRPLGQLFRGLIQLLAGIPSVVFGFFGLTNLVPWILELAPPGQSLLAGVLVLAMMILPTVALLVLATLEHAPEPYLRGSAALGLSRWTTLTQVLRPVLVPGVSVALVLGVMRAIGETMAVLMVAGNVVEMPRSLFDPVRTLTANIALELGYATAAHRSVLFVSGLALMGIVLALVAVQSRIERRARLA